VTGTFPAGNPYLTSLSGLANLTFVGGYFQIAYNSSLTNLTGLNNINAASIEDLYIYNNNSLSTCEVESICDYLASPNGEVYIGNNAPGCNSQQEVEEACSVVPCLPEGITFSTQEQIDNFSSNYPNCTEIEGDVEIDGGDITNLNGLNALSNIGGDLFIGRDNQPFGGNSNLTNVTGLENLTFIGGDLRLSSNDALTSLTGLENLTSIEGHLIVIWNDKLINLTGLENLSSIEGDVYIGVIPMFPSPGCGNNSLTSLAGLENLISIGGSLGIYRNDTLTSLSGLVNLTSIGDELEIRGNNALTSLTGLDNIEAGTISHLSIVENQFLSTCQVQSICDYLIV